MHGGIDDKRLEELQEELMPNMAKISRDNAKAPKWMDVTRNMTPDFVVKVSFKLLIELIRAHMRCVLIIIFYSTSFEHKYIVILTNCTEMAIRWGIN